MNSPAFFVSFLFLLMELGTVTGTDKSAEDLIASVMKAQSAHAFLIRAKLDVVDASSGNRRTTQILIRALHKGGVTHLLYETLWSSTRHTEALYIQKSGNGTVSGFRLEPPDKVTPLNSQVIGEPYLESNLSIEDLAEDFWQWPSQTLSGEENVNRDPCRILESRPSEASEGAYSLVRTWVSLKKNLPLRIEKYDLDKNLTKLFSVQKVGQRDSSWVPIVTAIHAPGKSQETTIRLVGGDRNAKILLKDFSKDEIKKRLNRQAEIPKE